MSNFYHTLKKQILFRNIYCFALSLLSLTAYANDIHWTCEAKPASKIPQKVSLDIKDQNATTTRYIEFFPNSKPVELTSHYQYISNGSTKNNDTNIRYYLSEDHCSILGVDEENHKASFGGPCLASRMSNDPTFVISNKKSSFRNIDYIVGGSVTGLYCK